MTEKTSESSPGRIAENISTRREAIRATRVGGETPDPTPVEIPVNANKPLTLREEMMRFIRVEMSEQAEKDDHESFEVFDDLDVPDDEEPDMSSAYTVVFVDLHDEDGAYLLEASTEDETPSEAPTEPPTPPSESEPSKDAEGVESPKDVTPAPSRG